MVRGRSNYYERNRWEHRTLMKQTPTDISPNPSLNNNEDFGAKPSLCSGPRKAPWFGSQAQADLRKRSYPSGIK